MNTNTTPRIDRTIPTPRGVLAPDELSTEGLAFHRLALASPRHRWWRPLVTIAITVITWLLLSNVFSFALGVATSGDDTIPFREVGPVVLPHPNHPVGALLLFGQLALLVPAMALGVRLGEGRSLGTLTSVAGRLRWGRLGTYLGLAALVMGAAMGASLVVSLLSGAPGPEVGPATLGLLAVALLVVPFQAAAEEYAFRALPQQVLGSWLKSPWWGILLPIPLFTLGHLYDMPGLASVAMIALVAGILTWRTGGLEAAIALHVVNNVVAVVLTAFGMNDLGATVISLVSSLVSIAGALAFTAVVLVRQRRVAGGEAQPAPREDGAITR